MGDQSDAHLPLADGSRMADRGSQHGGSIDQRRGRKGPRMDHPESE
jgi:hypothetical protein